MKNSLLGLCLGMLLWNPPAMADTPGLSPSPKAPVAEVTRWIVQLQGTDAEEARSALDNLLAGGDDARRRTTAALTELVARRQRLGDDGRRRLTRKVAFLAEPRKIDLILKALDQHADASAEAIRFAFSDSDYAVPDKARTGWSPGRDYQKGQILLEGRIEVAIARFNQSEAVLVQAFGLSMRTESPGGGGFGKAYLAGTLRDTGQPLHVLKYNIADSGPAWAVIGEEFASESKSYEQANLLAALARELAGKAGVNITAADGAAKPAPPASRPTGKAAQTGAATPAASAMDEEALLRFARAVGALFAGEYARAAELKPEDVVGARLFDLLVRRHVMVRSAKQGGPWSLNDMKAMHLLNLYRLSLDLWPMMANPKIYAAAAEHSQWQDKNNTMSHIRPEADKRSPSDRCKLAGYDGSLGENIAGGSVDGAIWTWRADAGHHRNLLNRSGRAFAIAGYGRYVTYDPGRTLEVEGLAELTGSPAPRRPKPDPSQPVCRLTCGSSPRRSRMAGSFSGQCTSRA